MAVMELIQTFVILFLFSFSYSVKIDTSEALQRLQICGFFSNKYDETSSPIEGSMIKLIRDFQRFAGLKDTGHLDQETIQAILTLECQAMDRPEKILVRMKRYNLEGTRWQKGNLTYGFLSYPVNLPRKDVESEVSRAFAEWSRYGNLIFTKVEDAENADIRIEFKRYSHKDGFPFDGDGTDLAHGFYPGFGGDIHFDKSEKWTIDSDKGINLFEVALHEIGHTLGLDHSSIREAVMWPTVHTYNASFGLQKDEIDAIRSLYGPKVNRALNLTEILCTRPGIDAATTTRDDEVYVFKDNFYWNIDDKIPVVNLIQNKWPGLLGNVDDAFTDNLGRTFFFTGKRYWRFSGFKLDPGYPRKISEGFPGIPDNIDAAFSRPGNNSELYFLKGNKLWKYVRGNSPHVSEGYPKLLSEVWEGLPSNLDAAIMRSRTVLFAKGFLSYNAALESVDANIVSHTDEVHENTFRYNICT